MINKPSPENQVNMIVLRNRLLMGTTDSGCVSLADVKIRNATAVAPIIKRNNASLANVDGFTLQDCLSLLSV